MSPRRAAQRESLGGPMKVPVLIVLTLCGLVMSCASDVDFNSSSSPVGVMGPRTYRFGATTDGSTWWWEVSFDDVKNTPDWRPGEEPPLAVSKAIQLAE